MRISDWSSDVCSSDLPLSHAPSRPDHATDHVDERRIDVLPNRIIGVITANREFALYKSQCHSLHHQRVVHAQHINAIAQPRRALHPVDHALVAMAEGGTHGFYVSLNHRSHGRIALARGA